MDGVPEIGSAHNNFVPQLTHSHESEVALRLIMRVLLEDETEEFVWNAIDRAEQDLSILDVARYFSLTGACSFQLLF